MIEMRAIRAVGQLVMAGSASRWALALFWTAERSPGVSESLASFEVVPAVESLNILGQEDVLGGL